MEDYTARMYPQCFEALPGSSNKVCLSKIPNPSCSLQCQHLCQPLPSKIVISLINPALTTVKSGHLQKGHLANKAVLDGQHETYVALQALTRPGP